MLKGLMMEAPLSLIDVLDYGARIHRKAEIVSVTVEGGLHRQSYARTLERVARLAHGLVALGVKPGDRVATLAWNGYRHLELYYAIAGIGAVCHTINPRLPADQMAYIVNHADDSLLFFDTTFAPLVSGLRDQFPEHTRYVAMTDRAHMPDGQDLLCYEDLLDGQPDHYDWPELDENTACALCYTSGTTGAPKGALYSHRSCLLQAMFTMVCASGSFPVGDRVLPVVPMFHVNAWGLPYMAPLAGASLIMPGPALDGDSLFRLMDEESVDSAWGVPTVWLNLLAHLRDSGEQVESLTRVVVGGSACPLSVMEEFDTYGVDTRHAWGMTEMSPLGTTNHAGGHRELYSPEQFAEMRTNVGTPIWGVEIKITDDDNNELPWDGEAFGALKVRGPWICSSYFKLDGSDAHAEEGWFETGDVATVTPDGFVSITDRTKDVIKSGGEWISSIEVENVATGHPQVAEAAVIGRIHEKWGERPLLIVVKAPGEEPSPDELKTDLDGKIAKWWIPDDVQFIEDMPHTATGKIQKTALRDMFADYQFPG